MKKLLFLLIALTVLVQGRAAAQITITADDMRAQYGRRISASDFEADLDAADATVAARIQSIADDKSGDAVYDLTGLSYALDETYSWSIVSCGTSIPGCENEALDDANVITKFVLPGEASGDESTSYGFARINDDGLFALGGSFVAELDDEQEGLESAHSVNDPAYLEMKLPLALGTEWTASTTSTITGDGYPFPVQTQMSQASVVEGWGLLKTPAGSLPALKVRTTTTFMGLPPSTSVGFHTKGGFYAYISLGSNNTASTVSYQVFAEGTAAPAEQDAAEGLKLEGASPNPVRNNASIVFELEQSGPVRLAVYDALGREVAVLAQGVRPAGRHEARLEAGRLAPGVYVYALEAGGRRVTRSLVVVK